MQKYKATGHLTLFDEEERQQRLSKIGNPLDKLSKVIDFEMFRNELENGETGEMNTRYIYYTYDAHRLLRVESDDALSTEYCYDASGRVDTVYDESGVMCYQYGNMGEVTKETRIYALPFLLQPIALTTQFRYDSWGRVDSIFYPDGERLKYQYDLGGQLERMYNSSYTY